MSMDEQLKSALIDIASKSPNTERAYRQARDHFSNWGGYLPATEAMVDSYVRFYANKLSIKTLELRIAALAKWHNDFGFPDPTKGKLKETMKGVRALYNSPPKKAAPLALEHLELMVDYLDQAERQAISDGDHAQQLFASRNRALVLIGFWRAFRGDELTRLVVENITVIPNNRMQIFLSRTKGDREARGREFTVPVLARLCPVTAYMRWLQDSGIRSGPVFRGISRWGRISDTGLTATSVGPILRHISTEAEEFRQQRDGDVAVEQTAKVRYTSHSFRHGFATWAVEEGWSLLSMMEYVGWKSVPNAQGYMRPKYNWGEFDLERSSLSSPRWELGAGNVIPGFAHRLRDDE